MAERQPGYFAVIPADVRYNDNLPANAKLMYGEISALIGKDGFCFAGNGYFADLYGLTERTVSKLISKLQEHDFIRLEFERDSSGQILSRKIYLKVSAPEEQPLEEKFHTPRKNLPEGIEENFQYTDLSITDNKKEKRKKKTKTALSSDEVRSVFVDWIRCTFPGRSSDDLNGLYLELTKYADMRSESKSHLDTSRKVNGLLSDLIDESNGDFDTMRRMLRKATNNCWLSVHAPNGKYSQAARPQEGRVYEQL